MRMVNPADQTYVRRVIETLGEDDARMLPDLDVGEAILSGQLINFDTVAEILNSIWTVQVIVFILPVLTFFPRRAKYVRTGCIRARPHRGDCRRQGPPSTSMCALQPYPAAHALPTMRP